MSRIILLSRNSKAKPANMLVIGKVFKPVRWAKQSLARSGSASMGGKTGDKLKAGRIPK